MRSLLKKAQDLKAQHTTQQDVFVQQAKVVLGKDDVAEFDAIDDLENVIMAAPSSSSVGLPHYLGDI